MNEFSALSVSVTDSTAAFEKFLLPQTYNLTTVKYINDLEKFRLNMNFLASFIKTEEDIKKPIRRSNTFPTFI